MTDPTTTPELTKAEMIEEVLWLDALTAQLKARAAAARARLEGKAREEYLTQKVRVTWGHQNGTSVPLSLTADRYDVTDREKWIEWVASRYPTEIERITRVREHFETATLNAFAKMGPDACTDQGEVPPGLTFVAGGTAKGIQVRYGTGVKASLAVAASETIDQLFTLKGDTAE